MSTTYIPVALRKQVYKRAKGCCEYCLIPDIATFVAHEIDHIIAEKHGGLTQAENLALSCTLCNKYKGSDLASIDPEIGNIVPLYHPRQDLWDEHFQLKSGCSEPATDCRPLIQRIQWLLCTQMGIKLEKVPLPPAQSLTSEQMERVWSALELLGETKQRDTALVHILSHGLRAGEVVQLNIGSFDGKLLFLPDTKTNEPRLVPLKKESREVLAQYLRSRLKLGELLLNKSFSSRDDHNPLGVKWGTNSQSVKCTLYVPYMGVNAEQSSQGCLGYI